MRIEIARYNSSEPMAAGLDGCEWLNKVGDSCSCLKADFVYRMFLAETRSIVGNYQCTIRRRERNL